MAQLNYTAKIDLLPPLPNDIDLEDEMRGRIGTWSAERHGTLAYSVHDAVGLVQNAKPASVIRIWNANFFKPMDLEWVRGQWDNIVYMNLPGLVPDVNDVIYQLPRGPGAFPIRRLDEVFFTTIHHTVGWNYLASNLQNAKNIASGHINGKGWPGIGYHYLIGPNGEILQTNHLLTSSFHAGSYDAPGDENRTAIGVCLGGDFRMVEPSMPQQLAASSIVSQLRYTLDNHLATVPHKRMAGAATICPGQYNLNDWLIRVDGYMDWI